LAEPETETVKVIRDSRYSAKNYGYLSKTQEWCKTGNCCTHLKIPAKLRGGGVFLLKQVSCEAFSMLAVKQKCRTFSFKRKIAAEKQCFLRRKAENPALSYVVTAEEGTGKIEAGFIVDLWEAPAGFVWEPVKASDYCQTGCGCCDCNPRTQTGGPWILPGTFGEPPLASRTAYKEYASADGTWSFTKNVSYSSVMPGTVSSGAFPINQVLVP
jgi:hypothetical protein